MLSLSSRLDSRLGKGVVSMGSWGLGVGGWELESSGLESSGLESSELEIHFDFLTPNSQLIYTPTG